MDFQDLPAKSIIGRRIGAYRLEEEVGRGGMGVVYRAVRVDGEFDQTVAIKLIKRGMDTDMILKRFRRERQITAALNHPNIAYFFGGGSTDDGLPYFVMEFIVGFPLYKYCDENRLSLKDRLGLFRQICWAVQAAHDIKVIHRDLKPSNIMVNSDGKPKLLDFGIAKALDPELMTTEDIPTATQMRAMTPEYASPEQINGETVDSASDIYSLGVILYELLTGHRPYKFRRRIADEVARVIREEEPTNPSGSLTRDEALLPQNGGEPTLEKVLAARNSSLDALRRELTGDLDRIVLKALRKRPADRYRKAADFADDITNYLEGRPVNAEFFVSMSSIPPPPKKIDSLSVAILPFKTLGQMPGDTGDEFMGIGLADALISRLSGVQRLVVRPTSSVLPFVNADPFDAGRRLDVDFVLDGNVRVSGGRIRVSVQLLNVADNSTRWAKAFDSELTDVLELEDTLSGQVTGALIPHLTSEEQARIEKRGTYVPEAYQAYLRGRYFWSRFTDADLLKAVDAYNQAIELDPDYVWPYIGLAEYYTWSAIFGEMPSLEAFPKSIAAARRALEIDSGLGEAYASLAFAIILGEWNWAEGELLAKRAIELSPNYPFAHECYSNYLVAQGRFTEGLEEIKLAEDLDPGSPRTMLMRSWALYQSRRFEESVERARLANAMQPDFPQGLLHLGNSLTGAGEYEEAVVCLRESSELWGDSGMPRYMLAHARAESGDMASARKILDKMLETEKKKHVKPYFIAMCFVAVRDYDSAFEWFERAVAQGNEWMIWFGTEPKLDPLRSDPRYCKLLEATNNPLADEQRVRNLSTPTTGERERSIAVLPFKLIGAHDTGSTEDEYLSLGLADAVTMRLSNVRKFLVRPTSSVLPFSGKETDPFVAGRELGVEYVVDGIIRHVGGRIRVTAQLLNVSENSTRWSASFAENFTDVLELEDSISEQVTKQLVPQLTGADRLKLAKRGTNNPRAHDAYLQGRYFWNQFAPDSFPKAIDAFRRAIELDPNYALAHVGVADYYTWACIYGIEKPAEGFPRVFEYANRALELDPSLAEGYAALGLYYSNLQEWEKCEEYYRRSLELNPYYSLAHEWLSAVLVATKRFDEGTEEILTAEKLDPLALRPKVLSAWTIYQTRDYALAEEKARELVRLNADFMQSPLQLANILTESGDKDEALLHARRAVEIEPNSPLATYPLCFALANAGMMDEAVKVRDTLTSRSQAGYIAPYFLAMCEVATGNRHRAVELLHAARIEKSAWILWLATEPKLDPLRDMPEFTDLVKTVGLPR